MLLTVEALAILLAAHKCLVHAKEALRIAKSAVMWCPEFVVRVRRARIFRAFALWLVKLREINVDEEGLVALFDGELFVNFILSLVVESTHVLGIGSIDHELL